MKKANVKVKEGLTIRATAGGRIKGVLSVGTSVEILKEITIGEDKTKEAWSIVKVNNNEVIVSLFGKAEIIEGYVLSKHLQIEHEANVLKNN